MDDGAVELDMVVNIGKVLVEGLWTTSRDDIAAVVDVGPQARGEGEGDLRELLPQGRAQERALPHLRRGRGRLGEDLDRLRRERGDGRRPDADAEALARRTCR